MPANLARSTPMPIAIIVHGGAGTISPHLYEENRAGCRVAALAGWNILTNGGSALDAVEAAVRGLGGGPHFEAGFCASLSIHGEVTLDAGVLVGASRRLG